MKKWYYLVAALMLSTTATTFTSCVDTDEPEGILDMRHAKADYIRALASVESAKIAYQQAAALSEQANADLKKAQAEAAKLQAQIAADEAKVANEVALKIAEAQAQAALIVAEGQKNLDDAKAQIAIAEAQKVLAEAMDEKARTEQLIAENQIKLQEMEAKLQVVLQEQETKLAKAEAEYQLALRDIAALDLVMSDVEAAVLNAAKTAYTTAYNNLFTAKNNVITAQKALLSAIYNQEDGVEGVEKIVTEKTETLNKLNAAYESLKDLLSATEPTEWEKKIADMQAVTGEIPSYIHPTTSKVVGNGSAAQEYSELELKKQEILQGATAEKQADQDARQAYIAAQQEYNFLANESETDCFAAEFGFAAVPVAEKFGYIMDGTHPTQVVKSGAKKYAFDGIKEEITNETVATKLGLTKDSNGKYWLEAQALNDDNNNKVSYNIFKDAFTDDQKEVFATETKIKNWTKVINASVSGEDKQEAQCAIDALKKTMHDNDSIHTAKVADFKAKHDQMESGVPAVTVSVTKFEEAIGKFNTEFGKLKTAIDDYNAEVDKQNGLIAAATTKAETDLYNKTVGEETIKQQILKSADWLNEKDNAGIAFSKSEVKDKKTIAEIEALIRSKNSEIVKATESLAKDKQLDAEKVIKNLEASSAFKNALRDSFTDQAAYDKFIKDAQDNAKKDAASEKAVVDAKSTKTTEVAKKKTEITKAETELNKLYNPSDPKKNAVTVAINDYVELAAAAAQVQTDDAKKITADQLTGVGTKYINDNDPKEIGENDKSKSTATDWYKQEVELKKDAAKYSATEHYVLVRSAVASDKMKAVEALKDKVDEKLAENAWIEASNVAFGTAKTAAAARHTELVVSLEDFKKDPSLAAGTLKDKLQAALDVEQKQDIIDAQEDFKAVKTVVDNFKAKIQGQMAEYATAVAEAKKALEPAKNAHLAAHAAYLALTSDIEAKQDEIVAKVKAISAVKAAAQAVIDNYYWGIALEYVDKDGKTQKLDWWKLNSTGNTKDFAGVKSWVESEMAKFEAATGVNSIKAAEEDLALAQKELDRVKENLYGKNPGHDFIITDKQNNLEKLQGLLELAEYDFAVAEANLNSVLEALGDGIAITLPGYSATGTVGSTIGGASSAPTTSNTDRVQINL